MKNSVLWIYNYNHSCLSADPTYVTE